jgi:SAM-dependent methyltransferase
VYESLNLAVLEAVPGSARRILDLGCGSGALGAELRRRTGAFITGVTASAPELDRASLVLNQVLNRDLDSWDPGDIEHPFDVIVCSHVLEHLKSPERLLSNLARLSGGHTRLIVALPNALHWRQRLGFLRGEFRYTEGGLMDRTHLRFYTWDTAQELVIAGGWRVHAAKAEGHAPGVWRIPWLGPRLDAAFTHSQPGLFADQFILTAEPASPRHLK